MYLRSLLYVVFLQLRRVSIYGYFWIFYYFVFRYGIGGIPFCLEFVNFDEIFFGKVDFWIWKVSKELSGNFIFLKNLELTLEQIITIKQTFVIVVVASGSKQGN